MRTFEAVKLPNTSKWGVVESDERGTQGLHPTEYDTEVEAREAARAMARNHDIDGP
jgi:hypothetical protein